MKIKGRNGDVLVKSCRYDSRRRGGLARLLAAGFFKLRESRRARLHHLVHLGHGPARLGVRHLEFGREGLIDGDAVEQQPARRPRPSAPSPRAPPSPSASSRCPCGHGPSCRNRVHRICSDNRRLPDRSSTSRTDSPVAAGSLCKEAARRFLARRGRICGGRLDLQGIPVHRCPRALGRVAIRGRRVSVDGWEGPRKSVSSRWK